MSERTSAEISPDAAVCNVPNATRQEVTVRARHRFFLEGPFHVQKVRSKLLNDAFYAYLTAINQAVGWVRPDNRGYFYQISRNGGLSRLSYRHAGWDYRCDVD